MKYRKTFGWAKSLTWLVGDGEGDDKSLTQAQRIAFLEKRNQDLQNMDSAALRAKIAVLESDLQDQREKHRKALDALEKEKTVLTTEVESYRAYGKPEELKTKLDTLTSTTATLEQYRMNELVASAAKTTRLEFEVSGKKESRAVNPDNLAELVKLHGLKLELKDGTLPDADGKPVATKIAHVLLEEGKSKPLGEYIGTELGKFASWVAEAPTKPIAGGTPVVVQPNSTNPTPAPVAETNRNSETYRF
jgi:hypothetical protein